MFVIMFIEGSSNLSRGISQFEKTYNSPNLFFFKMHATKRFRYISEVS